MMQKDGGWTCLDRIHALEVNVHYSAVGKQKELFLVLFIDFLSLK